jgi:hypothetical protein
MSNDVAFLAEFSGGTPTRGALELAAGCRVGRSERRLGGAVIYGPVRPCGTRCRRGVAQSAGDDAAPAITMRRLPRQPAWSANRAAAPATPNGATWRLRW